MNETTPNSSAASGTLLAGAALAGVALFATAKSARAVSPSLTFSDTIFGTGDVKVLNYALALEALEADLYAQALLRLTTGGTNALGKTISGLNLSDNDPAVTYLRDFGKIEAAHRDFFIGALGNNAITSAGKPLSGAKFDFEFDQAKATVEYVLKLVQTAELTGTRAYIDATKYFATATYLQTAAAIQGTEARHTAIVTALINKRFGKSDPVAPLASMNNGFDSGLTPNDTLNAVSPFIVLAG